MALCTSLVARLNCRRTSPCSCRTHGLVAGRSLLGTWQWKKHVRLHRRSYCMPCSAVHLWTAGVERDGGELVTPWARALNPPPVTSLAPPLSLRNAVGISLRNHAGPQRSMAAYCRQSLAPSSTHVPQQESPAPLLICFSSFTLLKLLKREHLLLRWQIHVAMRAALHLMAACPLAQTHAQIALKAARALPVPQAAVQQHMRSPWSTFSCPLPPSRHQARTEL